MDRINLALGAVNIRFVQDLEEKEELMTRRFSFEEIAAGAF